MPIKNIKVPGRPPRQPGPKCKKTCFLPPWTRPHLGPRGESPAWRPDFKKGVLKGHYADVINLKPTPPCRASTWPARGRGGGGPSFRRLSRVTQRTCPTHPGRPNEAPELQPAPHNDHGCWLGALGTLPTAAECRPAKLAAWSWEASDLHTYHASSSDGRSMAPRSNRGTTDFAQRKRACEPHRAEARKTGKLGQPVPPASFFCKQAQAQAQGPPMRRLATSKHASLQHCLLPATALHQQPGPRQMELLLLRAPSAPLPPKLQLATRVAAVTAAARHAAPAPAPR